jgi:hypothetical protein
VERRREAIAAVVTQAYHQDAEADAALGSRRGDAWPAALARREDRLATIAAAMQRLEARAPAEAEAERQRRAAAEAARQRTGTMRRGRAPQEVAATPNATAQMRFTDPAWQSRQRPNKGWDDGGNAQGSVAEASQIIVACDVTGEANDKQLAAPMTQLTVAPLEQAGIEHPTDAAGVVQKIPGTYDRGYASEAAAQAVEQRGCEPSRATGRQRSHVLEPEEAEAPTTAQARRAPSARGTGVWPEQRSAWFSPIFAARLGQDAR